MPNGNCLTFNDRWTEACHEGSTCIKIDYDIQCSREDEKWAGISLMPDFIEREKEKKKACQEIKEGRDE